MSFDSQQKSLSLKERLAAALAPASAFVRGFVDSFGDKDDKPKEVTVKDLTCCSGTVHVAYRGVSDERLYLAYSRKVSELKFFRQNGLRVFCADCRRRIV